jgi:hypothetical protein
MIVALDTEAFYSDEVSIKVQGTYHYLRHPDADLYLLSIVTDTGLEWAGHPKDFDWSQIVGPDVTWLSHNAAYDSMVVERLMELGNAPETIEIKEWVCTADMAAALGYPRSLKAACEEMLGVKMSKTVRDNMKDKRWEDMDVFFQQDVIKYAIDDSRYCLQLYLRFGDQFSETERNISALTRSMCSLGVPLDEPGIDKAITALQTEIWEARINIPWADKEAILSPGAIRDECKKVGIWAPSSFAKDDPEAEKWEDEFADQHSWIRAVRSYRRANKHLATLQAMRTRLREDGTMPYGLKYFGAHTGRDSGDAGINLQNLPKGKILGVDVRSMIKAPEDHTLVIVDLAQIEPRVLHWLAGDTKMLDYIRRIPDLYEAQARAWGLYSGKGALKDTDKALRHQIKQLALGLGYGMGAKKFATVANVDSEEAERLVKMYRSKNPLITQLWRTLEDNLRATAKDPDDHDANFPLPSGRTMTYRKVSADHNGLTAMIPRQGQMMRLGFWGGVLTENLVQAVARDVFMDCCLRISGEGIPIIMRVHDEVVCQVQDEAAESALELITEIMSTPPDWADGLPLAAEGSLSKCYTK